jgi:hypothetical protein
MQGFSRSARTSHAHALQREDHRSVPCAQTRLPAAGRLLGLCGRHLRALLVAATLAPPLAIATALPATAEKVVYPQGGGPSYFGSVGPWEFYRVIYKGGSTSCAMVGFVGRMSAPSFSFGLYYDKGGKFAGGEIRFEGIASAPPKGAAARAQLQIGDKAFAMQHPEEIAHTGFFLANQTQANAVIEALTARSTAKGNRSFLVVQGGKRYKFDARDFTKALERLEEKCGPGK